MSENRKFRILSIDGGGLRGIVPLQVIKYIESVTNKEIHKTFDLIAGTSTGGILTGALTLQDSTDIEGNKRKFSLDDLEKIYTERGKEIFPVPSNMFSKCLKGIMKWFSPHYDPNNLEDILVEHFGDSRITSCLKPIYITSYDIHRNRPLSFTFREATFSPDKNSKLTEICRATSAAPTYFPTYSFNYESEWLTCVDGGVCMNNPSLGALVEVLGNSDYKFYRLENEPIQLQDIYLLSLGTGSSNYLLDSKKSKNWGRIKWIKPVINLTMNGPSKIIHRQIETIFRSFGLENNYLRVDINIDGKYSEMADSSDMTIDYLVKQTNSQVLDNPTLRQKLDSMLRDSGVF